MTSKNVKIKNSYYQPGNYCGGDWETPDSYEQHLRKKHNIPDNCKILIKQGYVIKDSLKQQTPKLTDRGRLLDTGFRLNKIIYDEIEDEIKKIYDVIDKTKEEIEILEIQNGSQTMGDILLQSEIESITEKMSGEVSRSIRIIAQKSYKKAYENLTENWSDILGNTSDLSDDDLNEQQLYDTINAWLESFKTWLFDSINSEFDNSFLETKGYVQKGLLGDFFENVKESFSKVKEKVDALVRNTVSHVKTTAQKIAFKVQRVEKYQVVLSEHPKTCEKCRSMANGKPRNIAELEIGETAPPFHPNCGCTMIPYVYENKDGSLKEQAFIAANVAFELLAQFQPWMKFTPLYQQIKSSIWSLGALYLSSINCPLAREMFSLGMYGGGKGMSKKATSLMIEALQNSKHLQDKIFELTESGNDFDTGIFSFEFKKDEDTDLYYAVQNVNMRITGTNLGDGFWNIKVTSQDKYDFTTFRNSLAFADLANNLGEAMQRNGMMTEYDTRTEYEYVFQRG